MRTTCARGRQQPNPIDWLIHGSREVARGVCLARARVSTAARSPTSAPFQLAAQCLNHSAIAHAP
eukprot:6301192-Pyramimonas_sp.AAC.1